MANVSAANHSSFKSSELTMKVLLIIGFCHLLNDSLQAVVPAMSPSWKDQWD